MNDYNEVFRQRTKVFALKVIRFCDTFPKSAAAHLLSKQLIRAATSAAANYRAMCLGRSAKEKFAKLCIVVEAADETLFWLDLIKESGIVLSKEIDQLLEEATAYARVFTAYRAKLSNHRP